MDISRRSFLGGAIAATVVAVSPALALANLPVIYGDGIHDDWAGLTAFFNGKPFVIEGEGFTASEGRLFGGRFLLSQTLHIGPGNFTVNNCGFRFEASNNAISIAKDSQAKLVWKVGNRRA